jgi:arylsulfatase A-like enzyme
LSGRREGLTVVLVVLDCVREDAVGSGEGMPFLSSLARECTHFRGAVAPSPWTLPSHASLFTGLYPWEHGVHAKSSFVLGPAHPSIAATLRAQGFATASFSANALISPVFGLTRGADLALWGGWWEPYVRRPGPSPLSSQGPERSRWAPVLRRAREGPAWGFVQRASSLPIRFPFLLDLLQGVRVGVKGQPADHPPPIAPWIEERFDGWLGSLARDRDAFAFVNLMEAHEPYLVLPQSERSWSAWWVKARQRQDRLGWVAGRWRAGAEELLPLRGLYEDAVRGTDGRIRAIARSLEEHGRWENTLLVLTSDHGQAFGEHGALFHMLRVDEPLLRVPLWAKFPDGAGAGTTVDGWVSLVDIAPTIYRVAGTRSPPSTTGEELPARGASRPRSRPVLAMSDGLGPEIAPALSEARRSEVDHLLVAAYDDRWKLVHDATSERSKAFDIRADPSETRELAISTVAGLGTLQAQVLNVARRLREQRSAPLTREVEGRLRSWGYA